MDRYIRASGVTPSARLTLAPVEQGYHRADLLQGTQILRRNVKEHVLVAGIVFVIAWVK